MSQARPNPVTSLALGGIALIDLIVQLALVGLGVLLLFTETQDDTVLVLALWCLLGTAYWIAAVIAIAISVRRRATVARAVVWFERTRAARIVATTATFAASLVGLVAAVELLVLRSDPEWAGWIEWVAVWAMLVAWALFHWGFARIYARRHRVETPAPLLFPGEHEPRLADFVYFSFTNATAFSVSDVTVLTTRMRWTVVWHTTLAFFFNALILVLAVNTIIN